MKTIRNISLLVLLLSYTATISAAQFVWKGGTPGQENDWKVASNWIQGAIPHDHAEVLIPKSNSYPIITSKTLQIAYLEIDKNASLSISVSGALTINGQALEKNGILNKGTIKNDGLLRVLHPGKICIKNVNAKLINDGTITIDYPFNETFFAIHNSTYVNNGAFQIVERGI